MRKSKFKTLVGVIITLSVMCVGTIAGAVLLKQQSDAHKTAADLANSTLQQNTRTVYVVMATTEDGESTFLKAGTALEDGINVEKKQIYSSLPESAYITEDDLGLPLINTVADGTPVLACMVAHDEASEGDRDYEVRVANMMTSQAENDLVDIRILFPNGKDYVIASKKRVQNLNLDTASFSCLMNEEEMLRMGAATIDAFTISGTYIYTVRYTEGTISEETIPTYPVRAEVIALMEEDPNVVTRAQETLNAAIRANLERSLASLSKEHVTAVTSGWDTNDNAGNQVILKDSVSMEDNSSNSNSSDTVNYQWNFNTENDSTVSDNTVEEAATESTETEAITE